jgi:UDP-N-acetylglucosamine 2-epimerase (non-hydrolysing)
MPLDGPILHVAGARPNFPKLAPVYNALADSRVSQFLVHTGQHFDDALSGVFFRQLGLPEPDVNLGIGSGARGVSAIARMMTALEEVVTELAPKCVVVYGDVNSTVAAALVAVSQDVEIAHVEAGLRSRDRRMPEEINRVVTDHLATIHFVTSQDAVDNLAAEGIGGERVHFVGNTMIDSLLGNLDRFDTRAIVERYGLPNEYCVVTMHRPSNVDHASDAQAIVRAIHSIADQVPVVFPMHPRGASQLREAGIESHPAVQVTEPLGYVEFMGLVRGARLVVTDSGGVQEETTIFGVPCLTLRENTERPVTITHGTNRLVGRDDVSNQAARILSESRAEWPRPPLWDGRSGRRVADLLLQDLGSR